MSQLSKLLRHAADTGLISSDSTKPSVITGPIVSHSSPSPPANISKFTKNRRSRRANMAGDDEKNQRQPSAQECEIPKPDALRKRPSWIDLENCKNDSWFRQTLATPGHKEIFEDSMIPLPSPDDGAKRGQIYSPTRMDRTASPASDQGSASRKSTAPDWYHECMIDEAKEKKDAEAGRTEDRFTSELDATSKSRRKEIRVGRPENEAGGSPPKKDIKQWIRSEANAKFVLGMPLGQLEEKLRDGVLESEMDEHSEKWVRAYGLSDDD